MDPIFDPTLSPILRRQDRWSRKAKNIPSHLKKNTSVTISQCHCADAMTDKAPDFAKAFISQHLVFLAKPSGKPRGPQASYYFLPLQSVSRGNISWGQRTQDIIHNNMDN